jgi:hypothetical protein
MIKSTDLRIGNWYVNQWGEYLQVDPDLFGADNLESYPIPIPLTPEILEKCGFDNDDNDFLKTIDDRSSLHINLEKKRTLIESYDGIVKLKNINYLHRLQNLYYSLTNEELEFKP